MLQLHWSATVEKPWKLDRTMTFRTITRQDDSHLDLKPRCYYILQSNSNSRSNNWYGSPDKNLRRQGLSSSFGMRRRGGSFDVWIMREWEPAGGRCGWRWQVCGAPLGCMYGTTGAKAHYENLGVEWLSSLR